MLMEEKVSVVVPVYNVQTYLRQCLESLLEQTYRNLEILVVDDGSTDNSGVICDEYAEKDPRIKVLHKKNGGAASAKNAGLRIATGEFLTFADSDDYVERDAYEYMVKKLRAAHADVIQCSFREIYVKSFNDCVMLERECEFNNIEYLRRYTVDWTCGLLWDKMYRRKLFDDIFFEEGHIVDDEFFTYQGIMNAKKIIHTPKVIYNYRKRKSSVTAMPIYRERTIMDKLDYLIQRRKKIVAAFPELKQDIEGHYLNMLIMLSTDPFVSVEVLNRIKKLLNEYFCEGNSCKISFNTRIRLLQLQYRNTNVLLNKRSAFSEESNLENYFD